mmetsp:Transcript_66941/g.160312  ORF Transcript_66941/g.160312 Transcript_66941/m.160312 type:complete len:323 (+) Transcript_66941:120-1088(+)
MQRLPFATRGGAYQDPLQARADNADKQREADAAAAGETPAVRVARLAMVPFLVFMVMAFFAAFCLEYIPAVVVIVCVAGIVGALAASVSVRRRFQSMMRLVAIAIALGMLAGADVYYNWLLFYYKYKGLRSYTNVAAGQSAAEFGDAAMLAFSSESSIDVTRAIGYKSARLGQTVCVAPIVETSMEASDPVNFFAVGFDCCDYRGSFDCDDAGDANSRSALLLFRPSDVVSKGLEWRVDPVLHPQVYQEAIDMDKAVYSTAVSGSARLVRWSADPETLQIEFLTAGILSLCMISAIALVISVIAVLLSTPRSLRNPESARLA